MDEDDEFGDLYADLGGTDEGSAPAETSAPAAPPALGVSSKSLEDDDDEDEDDDTLYGSVGKSVSQSQEQGVKVDGAGKLVAEAVRVVASRHSESTLSNGSMKDDLVVDVRESRTMMHDFAEEKASADGSESESDDDLQIVLNNDKRAPENEAAGGEGNEEAEDVGVVNQAWTEDQPPPSEAPLQPAMGPPASLPPGLMPVDQANKANLPNPGVPRPPGKPFIGQQHHSQYKYVRAPFSAGGPPPAGLQNPVQGLGRGSYPPGNWGPGKSGPPVAPGAQGQLRPSGGIPGTPWAGAPGFPHGSDFHLPPTKLVFDMDLDALDDKPWRHPNADITDYFNFGFNENSWKSYCQQLSQLRLEATMQSKISVYESGRSEQPVGRAIQVEGGVGERRPSYDVRRNRNRDSDSVIEIVLQDAEEDTPMPLSDRMDSNEDDSLKEIHEQEGMQGEPSSRMGPMLGGGRNGPFMDADGPPFFPMGPRPRGPYRMFHGGPFGPRGGVMRPPFYEPGIPPLPMHMRPEGFPLAEYGDPSKRGTPSSMAAKQNPAQGRLEEEHSSGSVAVKEERKHAGSKEYKDERRSKTNRHHAASGEQEKNEDEDERSDEHKRSISEDAYDKEDKQDPKRHKRYSDSHSKSQRDGRKHIKETASDADYSSYSDDDDHKSRHRTRKEGVEGDRGTADKHSWQKKVSASDDKERRRERPEKDQRRDEEWATRRSQREKEDMRWKEEDLRRQRGREEEMSRRREDDGRKRDKVDEHWQRKERDESWRKERDDSQRRRAGYEESYERRDREEEKSGHSERSKRHGYDKGTGYERDEEEYLRRKSKHDSQRRDESQRRDDSQRRDYRDTRQYEDDVYDRKAAAADKQKEEERMYKDKYSYTSRGKEAESRRNGSTSDYLDDRMERKKRKADDYQKSAHSEKVQARAYEDDSRMASSIERKGKASSRSEAQQHHSRADESFSSEEDDDDDDDDEGRRRKGRSKMERWNKERPASTRDDWVHGEANAAAGRQQHSDRRQDKSLVDDIKRMESEKKSSSSAGGAEKSSSTRTANGSDRQQDCDSFAKRRERFMQAQKKVEGSSERRPSEKGLLQAESTEFKHERPARKRRWGS